MAARRVERRRGSLLILNPIPGVARAAIEGVCEVLPAGYAINSMNSMDDEILSKNEMKNGETYNFCDLEHNDAEKARCRRLTVNTLSFVLRHQRPTTALK